MTPGMLPEPPYSPENINRLGSYVGVMTQSDQGSPKTMPPLGDIKTAKLYGKRIAEVVKKLVK